MTLSVERFVSDLLDSNMYVVSEGSRHVVVDPCRQIPLADTDVVDYLLLTHEHYDHSSGIGLWKERFPEARVVTSRAGARNLEDPKKNMARYFSLYCEMQQWVEVDTAPSVDTSFAVRADIAFEGALTIRWLGHVIRLFELPGHSAGGAGIILDDRLFFSGDSLLPSMGTECRFPGGSEREWHEVSVPSLRNLSPSLTVLPGHFGAFEFAGEENLLFSEDEKP